MRSESAAAGVEALIARGEPHYRQRIASTFPAPALLNEPVIVYGAGRLGRRICALRRAAGLPVVALADASPDLHGQSHDGIGIISPEEMGACGSAPVLIASLTWASDIIEQLKSHRAPVLPLVYLNYLDPQRHPVPEYEGKFESTFTHADDLLWLEQRLGDAESRQVLRELIAYRLTFEAASLRRMRSSHDQYFDPLVSLRQDEVFVDCGAFDGDSVTAFIRHSGGQFRMIHAYEPDPDNVIRLRQATRGMADRVNVVSAGVFDHSGTLGFARHGDISSRIDDQAEECIGVVALDDEFRGQPAPPTFIKIDVEGADLAVIDGARETIATARPKIAVAVYHTADHLWQIPRRIDNIAPGYAFHLRHYSNEIFDTVLYALPAS